MNQTTATPKLWSKDFRLVIAVNFLVFTSMYMLLPTLPLYAQDISGRQSMAGLIVGIFTLAAVVIRPWIGNLLDNTGRKNILLCGIAIFAVTTAAYSQISLIIVLLAVRLFQGIGWGATTTATGTIASDVIPPERRAEGMAYFGMASTVAMSVGPAWGLYLIGDFGYASLFSLAAGLTILGMAAAWPINYEHRIPVAEKPALRRIIIEKTAVIPSLVLLFVALTYGGIVTFLPAYAAFREITDIGMFFTTFALALLLTRPLMGRAADKFSFSAVLLPGMVLLAAALLVLLSAASLTGFLLAAVLYGLGFGAVQPVLNAITVTLSPPDRRGAANATFMSAMDTGIGLGAILWGFVAEQFGFTYIYGCSALFICLALGLYLALLHKKLPEKIN